MEESKKRKRALVTGGSGGIGGGAVRQLAAQGIETVFLYHRGREAAAALTAETGMKGIRLDISDGSRVAQALSEEINACGGFDILVNAAGIAGFSLFQEIGDDAWQRMLAVNLSGAFYCCKAVLPYMIRQKWGRIVNISSMWGITGSACEVHYSAAKAGLIGLTKALAAEEAPSGITVNCIAPGVIDTAMNRPLGEETLRELAAQTPAGRLGTPEEVASLVGYLCSEEAGFITGQVICQSGGFVM